MPQNFKQAIKFDNDNGNTLWKYAIGKEMAQIKDFYTLSPLNRGPKASDDHTFVPFNMCFDVTVYHRKN